MTTKSATLVPVSRLAEFENGRAFGPEDFTTHGLPIIRIREFLDESVTPDRFDGYVDPRNLVHDGDLLFAWSATLAVGFWNREKAALNQHLFRVTPHTGIDKAYLRWALDFAVTDFSGLMHGSAMTHITRKMLKQVKIWLPALSAQRQIADYLDVQTAKIDLLVEKQERLIETLAERRQAVISHAVTKGLDPNAPMKESAIEWLGRIPVHWYVSSLKRVVARQTSGTSVNGVNSPADAGEVGVLKTSSVSTGRFLPSENKTVVAEDLSRVTCPVIPGAILVNRANSPERVGAAALVNGCFPNLFLSDKLWQLQLTSADSSWLYWWLQTAIYRDQVASLRVGTSASMQNLSYEDFREIRVALPPMETQLVIAKHLDRETAQIDALSAKAREMIDVLKERRQALISAAVTGKIDVRGLA